MTAEIIPFPSKLVRPLEKHELPAHWPDNIRDFYETVTRHGYYSHRDAFRQCAEYADYLRDSLAGVQP